jgi:hypothetical protein
VQQLVSSTQACETSEQNCGEPQVPALQTSSAPQQGTVAEQLSPEKAHSPPVPQVPLVAPGGMSQLRPAQQSAPMVQAPAWPWQGGRQVPASQVPEQHWKPPVQPASLGTQAAQEPPTHRELQQSAGTAHDRPLAEQAGGGGSTRHR